MKDQINGNTGTIDSESIGITHLSIIHVITKSLYQLIDYNIKLPSIDQLIDFSVTFNQTLRVMELGAISSFKNEKPIDCTGFRIPSSVETLAIRSGFSLRLQVGTLPPNLTELSMSYDFVSEDFKWSSMIPKTLLSLILPTNFNYNLQIGDLCEPLERLEISRNCSLPFIKKGLLPKTLKYLYIGSNFSGEFEVDSLPESLETLKLHGLKCDSKLPKLPLLLKNLELPSYSSFETNLPFIINYGCLPKSLKKLVIPNFDEMFENGLFPDSIEELKLWQFNQTLELNSLPKNLKTLELNNFNSEISLGSLPEGLESLVLDNAFNQKISKGNLPSTLKYLKFGSCLEKKMIELESLPLSLETLELRSDAPIRNGEILHCCNLKKLYVDRLPKMVLHEILPKSLKELYLDYCNYEILECNMLEGIEKLELRFGIFQIDQRNRSWLFDIDPTCFPKSLQYLDLGSNTIANFIKQKTFPNSLRTLKFGQKYSQELPKHLFPPSLTKIYLTTKQKNTILAHSKIPLYCSIVIVNLNL
ncbi:hypothetical protein DLAC_02045 [Tieghemostelium lacteum]|uniref:Leucine-rich repeat-containing protein (LRR) n=1 Tax=Tieghemostelium lacteum TaxID=361077 RepID=A0A152A528_TIELA|nr:hypothetical protein DLAC_02045 [Tieghemostelium lacteum]|eukprot:KYR01324.1 hypothetical protein DLAC_02045 [Tieghemostelium lacteum]